MIPIKGDLEILKSFSYGGCTFLPGTVPIRRRVWLGSLCKGHCGACIWDADHFLIEEDGEHHEHREGVTHAQDPATGMELASFEGYIKFHKAT